MIAGQPAAGLAHLGKLLPRLGDDLAGNVAAEVRLHDDRVRVDFEGEAAGLVAPAVGAHAAGAVGDDVQVAVGRPACGDETALVVHVAGSAM